MFWRAWRDKVKFLWPLSDFRHDRFLHPTLVFPELGPVAAAGGPELPPYQGLAAAWDDYATAPDYPGYLATLARRRGLVLDAVLDLACGTGILTSRLQAVAAEVVGLDASEPMLALARSRRGGPGGPEFVRGDFRAFDLGRQFDAAICASNSLNYVADRGELAAAFGCVGRHLRPGGLFLFDTTTAAGMRFLAGQYLHFALGSRRFALYFDYGHPTRPEGVAILPTGVEYHRRIPLDLADIVAASEGTGLVVEEHFSDALISGAWGSGHAGFFVLRRDGGG